MLLIFIASTGASGTRAKPTRKQQENLMTFVCRVSDPTGTPLNVRAKPGGRIVRKLKNGTRVYYEIESGDARDRAVALIRLSRKGKAIGWVLREYLDCEG